MTAGASPGTTVRARPPAVAVAVPPGGLTLAEAAARLARDGGNVLPAPRPVPLWRRVAAQARDPLALVLLAAAVPTVATSDWTDASVIALVIVVNTAVGVTRVVKAVGLVVAVVTLTVAVWGHATGRPWQSMAFFALSALGYAAVRLDRLVHPPRAGADMPGPGWVGRCSERSPAWPRWSR